MSEPVPMITVVVRGRPAPQGSKKPVGNNRMVESSKKLAPWREAVKWAALEALKNESVSMLDGPLVASMVFTVPRPAGRPSWWPKELSWSKKDPVLPVEPAGTPDLSKLLRSTEDALTDAGIWRDDARVVEYRRLRKVYVGDSDPDALEVPGVVVHVWPLSV